MYRLVYYLVHYDCKNYRDFFVRRMSGLISKSGSMVDTFSRKNTHKAIGDSPVRTGGVLGVRSEWGVPLKKISLCREVVLWDLQIDFLIYLTHFLEFWGARGLYITARDLPRAVRPKLVVIGDSRVLAFWVDFCPGNPTRDNSEMCSREVSWHDLVDSDGFCRSSITRDHWEQSQRTSATEIEPSYVGIGWKLIPVGPNPVWIEIS